MTSEGEQSDPARESIEHFHAAAQEMVAAARSMLDAVEELLNDPRAGVAIASAVGTVGKLIEGAVASVGSAMARNDDDDGDNRVQRIKVS